MLLQDSVIVIHKRDTRSTDLCSMIYDLQGPEQASELADSKANNLLCAVSLSDDRHVCLHAAEQVTLPNVLPNEVKTINTQDSVKGILCQRRGLL